MKLNSVISRRVPDLNLGIHLQDAAHRTILEAFEGQEVDTFVGPYVLFARSEQTAWLLDTREGYALPLLHPDIYLDLDDHLVEADDGVTIHWTHRYRLGPDRTPMVEDADGNEEVLQGYSTASWVPDPVT